MFFYRLMTRGDHLVHCISYALIRARKVVKGLSLTLSKEWAKGCCRKGSWWASPERRLVEARWGVARTGHRHLHTTPKNYWYQP